jgi:hypothetical protein
MAEACLAASPGAGRSRARSQPNGFLGWSQRNAEAHGRGPKDRRRTPRAPNQPQMVGFERKDALENLLPDR